MFVLRGYSGSSSFWKLMASISISFYDSSLISFLPLDTDWVGINQGSLSPF